MEGTNVCSPTRPEVGMGGLTAGRGRDMTSLHTFLHTQYVYVFGRGMGVGGSVSQPIIMALC